MSARELDVAAVATPQIQKGTTLPELKIYGDPTLIISTALSGEKRVDLAGFYLFVVVALTIGFAAVRFCP